jgi:carboxylesterase type B
MTAPLIRINIAVEQGTLCGVVDRLPNGKQFHYFRGIPYAVPPLGEHRFEVNYSYIRPHGVEI